jgi:hypothetical protein
MINFGWSEGSFHDSNVEDINFNFVEDIITVVLETYNDNDVPYLSTITFAGIVSLKSMGFETKEYLLTPSV